MSWLTQTQKPVSLVPRKIIYLIFLALTLQILSHSFYQPEKRQAKILSPPGSSETYTLLSLNEKITSSYLSAIWLQSFDNQAGHRLSYSDLNYVALTDWLNLITQLNNRSNYPMLLAAYNYSSVTNLIKQRRILDFIYQNYIDNPRKNWRWLAHAAIVAKHDQKDLNLALEYAQALGQLQHDKSVPFWVKDLSIVILEDMGKLEAAKITIAGLIANGEITDPYELRFLTQKFDALADQLKQQTNTANKTPL